MQRAMTGQLIHQAHQEPQPRLAHRLLGPQDIPAEQPLLMMQLMLQCQPMQMPKFLGIYAGQSQLKADAGIRIIPHVQERREHDKEVRPAPPNVVGL